MTWEPIHDMEDRIQQANTVFVPSSPIREAARLHGRQTQLQQVQRELMSPGRSVFIFGDRGVGKTSLAQTAALLVNRTESDPVFVRCYEASFSEIITKIVRDLMGSPHLDKRKRKKVTEVKLGGAVAHILHRIETEPTEHVRVEPLYAVDAISQVAPDSGTTVVVVDEVDQANSSLKRALAHFIKNLGDNDCPVKFIFTGIADDVNDLLEEHASAFRGIASVRLERLLLGDLMAIANQGFEALDIAVPDIVVKRIAMLSDGFAYFTHLLGLKLAQCAIDEEVSDVHVDALELATSQAVESSEVYLRMPYEKAVRKYQNHELILWALANHYLIDRQYKDLYEDYLDVCKKHWEHRGLEFTPPAECTELPEPPDRQYEESAEESSEEDAGPERTSALTVFTKAQFSNALQRLKNPSHGKVIETPREQRGWYRFTLPMMRGYCRIAAARQGIRIGLRYLDSHNRLVTLD